MIGEGTAEVSAHLIEDENLTRAPSLRRLPWLLSSLDTPGEAVGYLGPNWFASIMGTGIVANAAVTLPVQVPGQHVFALTVWVFDALLLLGLLLAVGAHWLR